MNFVKSLFSYIIIVLVVVLIRTFLFTPAIVNGSSMEKTLYDGELVIVNKIKLLSGVDRFDIVISRIDDELLIKRVIGLPNEIIEYKNNCLFINGELVEMPIEFEETDDFYYETKDDEYFLMGDNRDISKDSRIIGGFFREDIIGIVDLVIFPLDKIGFVK